MLLHAEQVERFGGRHGVIDQNVVESSLARPKNRYFYGGEGVDLSDLAAAYLCGFAQSQGFMDGNKRIGVAAALVFLTIDGSPLHVPGTDLYTLAMDVANNRVREDVVADWLRARL